MIRVTRLNQQPLFINLGAIAYIEGGSDTLVTLVNGERIHVREPVDELIVRTAQYQERVQAGALLRRDEAQRG